MLRGRWNWAFGLLLCTLPLAPAGAQVETVEELVYPALPDFEVPEPRRVELDNGMVVMLLEDHELPLIEVMARVRTGARLEPADKVGLASLTGAVLRTGGTTSMSGDEIDDYLESRAASIETSIGTVSGSASMSCLKGDFADVLALFADVLRNPVFDGEKLEVAKNQANTGIARQNDSPQQIMFREFAELVYGTDSPYARSETYASVDAVTREDLLAWHARFYHPNNIILGLVGDFDSDEALALVREAFAEWPAGPPAADLEGGHDGGFAPGVYTVGKDDITQSNIIMGHLGIERDNPDYLAVDLMNEVLGGSYASRLFNNVRTKKGLAYAVTGGVGSNFDYPGQANFWMTTKTETTAAGIDALLEEVRGMTASPPTADEVQKALAGILNSFVFNSDSRRKILGQQLTYEYFGYPLDWLSRYYEGIQQVTVEEVRQAAEKYLHPDEFVILVVGPSVGRERPLEQYGEVTEVDISIPELEVEQVVATDESRRLGEALVARAVEGVGGAERLDSVVSVRHSGTAVAKMGPQEMQMEMAVTFAFPGRFRQDAKLPFGTMSSVVTADGGFMSTPQGVQDLPESQLAEARRSMRRNIVALLRARQGEEFAAVALGEEELDGRQVDLLQVVLDGDVIQLAIARDSGEVVRVVYRGSAFGSPPGEIRQSFADFRDVGGLRLPFAASATLEGTPFLEFTIDEIEVDGALEEGMFERPASVPPDGGEAGG